MKYLLPLAVALLFFGCPSEKSVEPPSTTSAVDTQAVVDTQPVAVAPVQAQPTTTLPAGSPIPATGVLLWLSADDALASAKDGKVQLWQNPLVQNASAQAVRPDSLPAVVAGAINGHAVVRFDGTNQMLMSSVDIRPARMPEGTVITVFRSATAASSPLRKLYGHDNGGYDRAVGLDDRGGGQNYTVFTGIYVAGYFQLLSDTTYVVVDEYSPKEFAGWVNGSATLAGVKADWQDDALPNMYIGGTGSVFNEYWNGDLAELIVYGRKLSEPERMQVEDYVGQKYGVAIPRSHSAAATPQ